MQEAYELLSDDGKALVDYDKIIELKRQADELGKDSSGTSGSGADNSSAGNGGCNSSASPTSAIFAGFAFLSVLLLIKKKVFN